MNTIYLGILTLLLGIVTFQPAKVDVDCSNLDFPISSPVRVDDYFEAIQHYLNEGCSPFEINVALSSQEWVRAEYSLADFDGDQRWEIVFAANTCDGGGHTVCVGEYEGGLTVYKYVDDKWVTTTLYNDWYINQVKIIAIENLVGNDLPELVVKFREQGSGCAEKIHIYQWKDSAWGKLEFGEIYIPGSWYSYNPIYMDCGLKIDFSNKKRDGNKEIVVNFVTAPGYFAHGGVGQRAVATYKWDGTVYQPIHFMLYPSPYRIHTLRDAQSAFDRDDLFEAAYYYRIATNDDKLLNVLSGNEATERWNNDVAIADMEKVAYAYQTAFAHFRLSTIWLHLGYSERAQREIDDLAWLYPKDSPGSEFLDIALYFREQMDISKNAYQACEAVTQYIDKNYESLPSHFFWGDKNIDYFQVEDICAFTTE